MTRSFASRIFYNSQREQLAPRETGARTCTVCYGTGTDYVFGGDCPEGCKAEAPAAPTQNAAPALAPVVAGPAKPVKARQSAKFPHIKLEVVGNRLTFRSGPAFLVYDVTGGQLRVVDAMDGGYITPAERQHIVTTAMTYAQKAVA